MSWRYPGPHPGLEITANPGEECRAGSGRPGSRPILSPDRPGGIGAGKVRALDDLGGAGIPGFLIERLGREQVPGSGVQVVAGDRLGLRCEVIHLFDEMPQ